MEFAVIKDGTQQDVYTTQSEVYRAARGVCAMYGGGIRLDNVRNTPNERVAFVLKPSQDDKSDTFRRVSQSTRRRINAVCYHGHLAFMTEFFRNNPDSLIKSALESYDGLETFKSTALFVADRNIGNDFNPVAYDEACNCSEDFASVVYEAFLNLEREIGA